MTSAVNSGSESNTFKTVVRIGALVAWLGVGFFISGVLSDLFKLAEQPMPYNPATLVLAMFVISTIIIAAIWFGNRIHRIDRVFHLPTASAFKTKFVEAITDDASMQGLQSETFD